MSRVLRSLSVAAVLILYSASAAQAQRAATSPSAAERARECSSCAEWNTPHAPFRVFGNSYYVGTDGLGAVLITSNDGHILIDTGLPESASMIAANVRTLGFRVQDIKLIVSSHAHFDHVGGLAELQRMSGARVVASPASARMLRRGASEQDDPQYGETLAFPRIATVEEMAHGSVHRVGALAITAHFTPGHTPGGTSWSWRSCAQSRCLDLVYADSQTPISADGFLFTRNSTYPRVLDDFANGFKVLETLSCDILITPHPSASGLWERLAKREAGNATALEDRSACQRYAASARTRLAKRVADEATRK